MKENTNITEVAHNEINRLESINAELLEACGVALVRLKSGTKKENEFNKNVANLLEQAINKSKGN